MEPSIITLRKDGYYCSYRSEQSEDVYSERGVSLVEVAADPSQPDVTASSKLTHAVHLEHSTHMLQLHLGVATDHLHCVTCLNSDIN